MMNFTFRKKYRRFLEIEIMGHILTCKELAEYLKLTEVTIYKYAKEGKIPGIKLGGRWRFDKDKIDELMLKVRSKMSG